MGELLNRILSSENLRSAYERVVSNKGAAGSDKMPVEELKPHLQENWKQIRERIETGKYKPQPVKRVGIPKPAGGIRKLGIPTVTDQFIQQAIAQELSKEYEPTFSEYSFGFRSKRSAHDAVRQAERYINEGNEFVVEIDLESRSHKFVRYADDINSYVKT